MPLPLKCIFERLCSHPGAPLACSIRFSLQLLLALEENKGEGESGIYRVVSKDAKDAEEELKGIPAVQTQSV